MPRPGAQVAAGQADLHPGRGRAILRASTSVRGGPGAIGGVVAGVSPACRSTAAEQPAPGRGERRPGVLRAEPGEPVPVPHHDHGHGRVAEQGEELTALAVQGRSGFGDHAAGRDAAPGRPRGDPGDLPVQAGFLICRRNPGGHDGGPGICPGRECPRPGSGRRPGEPGQAACPQRTSGARSHTRRLAAPPTASDSPDHHSKLLSAIARDAPNSLSPRWARMMRRSRRPMSRCCAPTVTSWV